MESGDFNGILAREQHRLAQNRESARKFRQKKKEHLIRLEEERKELQTILSEKTSLHPRFFSPDTPSCILKLCEWYFNHTSTINKLLVMLSNDASEKDMGDSVRIGMEQWIAHEKLVQDALVGDGGNWVLTGQIAWTTYRPFLWLGGFQPSRIQSHIIFKLRNLNYDESTISSIARNASILRKREDELTGSFAQLQKSVASCLEYKELSLKLNGMWALVSQAENMRTDMFRTLWDLLDVRGCAIAICTPMLIMKQIDALFNALDGGH